METFRTYVYESKDIPGMIPGGCIHASTIQEGACVKVGLAFCSPEDAFEMQKAAVKSMGRAVGKLSCKNGDTQKYAPNAFLIALEIITDENIFDRILRVLTAVADGSYFKIHRKGKHINAAHMIADGRIDGVFAVLGNINIPSWCCPKKLKKNRNNTKEQPKELE